LPLRDKWTAYGASFEVVAYQTSPMGAFWALHHELSALNRMNPVNIKE
jgi:hypothetical protein